MHNTSTQASKLLPALFEHVDAGELITVLHVGPALPETVEFFSGYRCKLHFVDLFSELPIETAETTPADLKRRLTQMLEIQPHTQFDICLFWDLFNYLDRDAVFALQTVLRPHLGRHSLAHAFSVHNLSTPQTRHLYGISQLDTLNCRTRPQSLPGYAPHTQRQLKDRLNYFRFERSVLLPDSRLELLLQARP